MVGHFQRAGQILLAADLRGEDGGEQIVGDHPLDVGRHLLAAAAARHGQRARGGPAPARVPERGVEHGLAQRLLDIGRFEVLEGLFEREGLRGAERENDRLFGGCRLQLEIEAHAEALAQRQPPGAVDARAERRVNDQLLPARLVEEALEDHVRVGGHEPQRVLRAAEVFEQLPGGGGVHPAAALQLRAGRLQIVELRGHIAAQLAHGGRELDAAARRLAQPERDRGRRAVRVLDPHHALALHAANAPGGGAQQENVARLTLDREILVDRPDERALRFLDHAEVAGFGNHAAVEQRGEPRRPARAQHAVNPVAVNQRVRAPAALAHAVGQHVERFRVALARQAAERRGAGDNAVELLLRRRLGGDLGDDLLREHLDRRFRLADAVQIPPTHRAHHRRALDQLVERRGEERAVRRAAQRMAGAPHALQERADSPRRTDLADQIDRPDVDPQLERRRRHHRAQIARLEPLLHLVAALLGQAAVMARHMLLADPLGQPMRHPLRQRPRVDEDQRRAVLLDQLPQTVVDAVPQVVRGNRRKRHVGRLHPELQLALVPQIENLAVQRRAGVVQTGQKRRDLIHRLLRRRKPDASRAALGDAIQPRQRERQMAAPLVAHHRVDFIHDHRLHRAQRLAAALRREHQVERLRRRDQNVRRTLHDRLPLRRRRVARAHRGADARHRRAAQRALLRPRPRQLRNLPQRLLEIALDVVAQRLERRDVEDPRLIRQLARLLAQPHQIVDRREKRGQRLARAGRRGQQRVAPPGADRRPARRLRIGRRPKTRAKPVRHKRVEIGKRIRAGRRGGHMCDSLASAAGNLQ